MSFSLVSIFGHTINDEVEIEKGYTNQAFSVFRTSPVCPSDKEKTGDRVITLAEIVQLKNDFLQNVLEWI